MKKVFVISFFMATASIASACPNMTGTWTCIDATNGQNTTSTTNVTQENIPNGVLYHLTDSTGKTQDFYADGQTRQLIVDNGTGTMTVKCTGDAGIQVNEQMRGNDASWAADATFSYMLQDAHTLQATGHANINFAGEPPQAQDINSTCHRQ